MNDDFKPRHLMNAFEIKALVDDGTITLRKTLLDGNGGPYKVVRFDGYTGFYKVVLENKRREHKLYGPNELKYLLLRTRPPMELTLERWSE